jgi:dinuclear metal center YbgI/SA1388 family protein
LVYSAADSEQWDRSGLLLGNPEQKISKVLLTVDITRELIRDSVAGGYDLVISHHPYLVRQANSVADVPAKAAVLAMASDAGIAIYAAHTNADITETGVCASLAVAIGLEVSTALEPQGQAAGHGRVGNLTESVSLLDLARRLGKVLPATATGVRVAGPASMDIRKVAVLAGAGDSFIELAMTAEADVFITSDLRHHPTQEALELAGAVGQDFALIDISHWAAESLWLKVAAKELASHYPEVTFEVSDLRTDPWDFVVTQ